MHSMLINYVDWMETQWIWDNKLTPLAHRLRVFAVFERSEKIKFPTSDDMS